MMRVRNGPGSSEPTTCTNPTQTMQLCLAVQKRRVPQGDNRRADGYVTQVLQFSLKSPHPTRKHGYW